MHQAVATFTNRRDAEMAVEQILQEYGLDPNAVTITPESHDNSSGTVRSGGDMNDEARSTTDPKLAGRLVVSVSVSAGPSNNVAAALAEHGGILSDATR